MIKVPSRTIGIVNSKGGTCKSTTSIHLAEGLACYEKKILLVDLDPQGSTTMVISGHYQHAYQVFLQKRVTQATIKKKLVKAPISKHITLLGAAPDLYLLENQITPKELKTTIQKIQDRETERGQEPFEYIILDTPAGRGSLVNATLEVCNYVIIPTDISPTSFYPLLHFVNYIKSYNCKTLGVLITKWNDQRELMPLYEKYLESLQKEEVDVFKTKIRHDLKAVENFYKKTTIFSLKRSKIKGQVANFVDEVLSKLFCESQLSVG